MGGCEGREAPPPQAQAHPSEQQQQQQPGRGVLRKKTSINVDGDGPPLVVLDFDLTLTCIHCGKGKLTPADVQGMGPEPIFDTPPGRLRSLQVFLADLAVDTGAHVVILTLNTAELVQACLEMAGLSQYISRVMSCSAGKKGDRVMRLVNEHAPSRVIFADDDERNVTDVKQYVANSYVLHVSGTTGLQPRHMEWLFYASRGQLAHYHELRTHS